MNLYGIKDMTADKVGQVMEAVNDGIAIRQFSVALTGQPKKFRDEFMLLRLGSRDEQTGTIFPLEGGPKQVVMTLNDDDLDQIQLFREEK